MDYNTYYHKLLTDENMMDPIQHGRSDYPFHFYYDNLSLFDFNCIEWHWHNEFEFVFVEKGNAIFWAGEKQFSITEGQGFWVNSGILHRFYSEKGAVIPNFLLLPTFIAASNSRIYQKYIEPIKKSALDCFFFSPEIPWQKEALHVMKKIISLQIEEGEMELLTSCLVQELWYLIYSHIKEDLSKEKQVNIVSSQGRLQLMMQYIHQNFNQKLSLEEIAEQAMVSKSTALNLFHKYLHDTPVHYLLKYRLQEAAILLTTTKKKVIVIAENVGFETVDYFCKQFKKYYGVTPTEYRIQKAAAL